MSQPVWEGRHAAYSNLQEPRLDPPAPWSTPVLPVHRPQVRESALLKPNGIPSQSPGLAHRAYPGRTSPYGPTPRGLRQDPVRVRRNPVGVETHFVSISQGSSCLATLGFIPESRWDSARRTFQLVGTARIALSLLFVLMFWIHPAQAGQIIGPWVPIFKGVDHSVSTNLPGGTAFPNRHVVHALRVDLHDPDVRLLTTPRFTNYVAGSREVGALTVSDFLKAYRLQAAVNGNFFDQRNYYLPAWTPMDLFGLAISEGVVVSVQDEAEHASSFVFDVRNQATVVHTNWPAQNVDGAFTAVTGIYSLLVNGKNVAYDLPARGFVREANPRTALGVSEDRRFLYLVTIDGRQPGYSDGAYDYETAGWMLIFGASDAINLDGGGSTTMVLQDTTGTAIRVNRSSAVADSGRERTVGGHFGIFAKPLPGFINDVVAQPDEDFAQITWTTVAPASTAVDYGVTGALGSRLDAAAEMVTNHAVRLTGLKPKTVYFFRAISSDGAEQHVSPTFSFVTTNYVTTNRIFGLTNSWKFTTANLDGRNWTDRAYDDSAWSGPGPGLLWVDVRAAGPNALIEPRNTAMPANPGNAGYPYVTYYLRTHFILTNDIPGSSLAFSGLVDDGAVFHINGTEVARLRLPARPTSATLASGYPCDGDATCRDEFVIPVESIRSLAVGDNVLAVEVHNYNLRSADITFGLELSRIEPVARTVKLEIRSTGEGIVLRWDGSGWLLQSANEIEGPWRDLEGATDSPISVQPQGASQYYRLQKSGWGDNK